MALVMALVRNPLLKQMTVLLVWLNDTAIRFERVKFMFMGFFVHSSL